jgi:general secretion pathway protein G
METTMDRIESDLDEARSRRKAGWRKVKIILGGALLLVALLFFASRVLVNVVQSKHFEAQIRTAMLECSTIKKAVESLRDLDDSSCPTIQDLVTAKKLDGEGTIDPWGSRYKVICDDGDTRVISFGRDRKQFTPDDIAGDFKPADIQRVKEIRSE